MNLIDTSVFGQILQKFKTTTFPTVLEVINVVRFNLTMVILTKTTT